MVAVSLVLLLVAPVSVPVREVTPSMLGSSSRQPVTASDVTPPVGGHMYGYGARGSNVSEGVHDPLYAKALVLSDGTTKLAIVTL